MCGSYTAVAAFSYVSLLRGSRKILKLSGATETFLIPFVVPTNLVNISQILEKGNERILKGKSFQLMKQVLTFICVLNSSYTYGFNRGTGQTWQKGEALKVMKWLGGEN